MDSERLAILTLTENDARLCNNMPQRHSQEQSQLEEEIVRTEAQKTSPIHQQSSHQLLVQLSSKVIFVDRIVGSHLYILCDAIDADTNLDHL